MVNPVSPEIEGSIAHGDEGDEEGEHYEREQGYSQNCGNNSDENTDGIIKDTGDGFEAQQKFQELQQLQQQKLYTLVNGTGNISSLNEENGEGKAEQIREESASTGT